MTPPPAGSDAAPIAIVASSDEETRVLLRGLLRLYHFRVAGDARSLAETRDLVRAERPDLLVADAELADGSGLDAIAEGKRDRPGLRTVLVARGTAPPARGDPASPDAVLRRPFRIVDLADAIRVPGSAATAA
ncbi:MAG TPA: hypothetical protein VMH78_06540 [Thermoplasmata archaeon]|nr:hypothetical protein [Thermoplasmata archaeon]